MKLLVVVDYQKDFVDGTLGFEKAKTLENTIYDKVEKAVNNGDYVLFTKDTHYSNYLETREGKHLPIVHCLQGSDGHGLYGKLSRYEKEGYQNVKFLEKESFGLDFNGLYEIITDENENDCSIERKKLEFDQIELCGIVTNMCVISNAVIFQTQYPNAEITIDAENCASFDNSLHEKALDVMEGLQMNVINRK